MSVEDISFTFIRPNDHLPYYFSENDVLKIFEACNNLKRLAMFHTLFYGCLRASELCNLDDGDLDLKTLTIQMREEKDGAWQGEEEPWPERFEILGGTGEADVRN